MALRLLCSHTGCGSRPGNSVPRTQPDHRGHHDGGHHVGDAEADGVLIILAFCNILVVYVCMDYDAGDANAKDDDANDGDASDNFLAFCNIVVSAGASTVVLLKNAPKHLCHIILQSVTFDVFICI